MKDNYRFGTKAVHIGCEPDYTGAVSPPIYMVSTFKQPDAYMSGKYIYSRSLNPTRERLEKSIAALEEAKYALVFSSGMAAIDAVLRILNPEEHIIALDNLYGGTFRILNKVYNLIVSSTVCICFVGTTKFAFCFVFSRYSLPNLRNPSIPVEEIYLMGEISI